MVTKTTAEVLIEGMVVNGIETLFCLPGVQNDAFFDALHQSGAHPSIWQRGTALASSACGCPHAPRGMVYSR